jgi:hypothetical protein
MHIMNLKAAAALLAALMVLVSSLAITTNTVSAATDNSNELTTEYLNTTDGFGGGSHFYVKFGQDAAFGVIWGNNETPNNIYIVSYMSSYLGYIDVYDAQGNLVEENHLVKVYSIYAMKMDSLIEFSDGSGDGTVRYYRTYSSETGKYSDYHALRPNVEPLYKKVDLNTSWEATEPVMAEEGNNRSWELTLTAHNLPYEAIKDGVSVNGVLDNISLTFNLDASTVQKEGISVLQYSVNTSNGQFENLQQGANASFSGNVTSYHVKWSKDIQGWDFDASNGHRSLLLELDSLVGTMIPPAALAIMTQNQYQLMLRSMGGDTQVQTYSGDTAASYDGSNGEFVASKQALTTPRLTFGGERSRVGTFEWAQNCTVDGVDLTSHAQIMGAWYAQAWRWRNMEFGGVAFMVGLTYPGGNRIVQDPSISSEAITDLAQTTNSNATGRIGTNLGLAVIGAVAAAVLVGAVILVRRGGGHSGATTYEKKEEKEDQNDWSQYYEKK